MDGRGHQLGGQLQPIRPAGKQGLIGHPYHRGFKLVGGLRRIGGSGQNISPALTWCDPMDGMFARGGALELGLALRWSLLEGVPEIIRTSSTKEEQFQRLASLIDEFDSISDGAYRELPVEPSAALDRHGVPDLGGFGAVRDDRVPAWSTIKGRHADIQVPCAWVRSELGGTQSVSRLCRPTLGIQQRKPAAGFPFYTYSFPFSISGFIPALNPSKRKATEVAPASA